MLNNLDEEEAKNKEILGNETSTNRSHKILFLFLSLLLRKFSLN